MVVIKKTIWGLTKLMRILRSFRNVETLSQDNRHSIVFELVLRPSLTL